MDKKSYLYPNIGFALEPAYAFTGSLKTCKTFDIPSTTEFQRLLKYLIPLKTYIDSINNTVSEYITPVFNELTSFDREINAIWTNYKNKMSGSSGIIVTQKRVRGKIGTTYYVRRGHDINFLRTNYPAFCKLVDSLDALTTVASESFTTRSRNVINKIKRDVFELISLRDEMERNHKGDNGFDNYNNKISALTSERKKLLLDISSLKQKVIIGAGTEGILILVATIAFLVIGTGAATLPFLSGGIILAGSIINDSINIKQLADRINDNEEKIKVLLSDSMALDITVYATLNSWITWTQFYLDSLESGITAFALFKEKQDLDLQSIKQSIATISSILKRKGMLGNNADKLKSAMDNIQSKWNFDTIGTYNQFKDTKSYCIGFDTPKYSDVIA